MSISDDTQIIEYDKVKVKYKKITKLGGLVSWYKKVFTNKVGSLLDITWEKEDLPEIVINGDEYKLTSKYEDGRYTSG